MRISDQDRADLSGVLRRRRLSESYPAEADAIAEARRAVAEFASSAGASEEQIEAILVAASEALTNVVLHAYPARPGWIHVTAEVAGTSCGC